MSLQRFLTLSLFFFQLLISEGIFLIHVPRRKHFVPRGLLALAFCFALIMLTEQVFSLLPGTIPVLLVYFTLFFAYSVLGICFCFHMPLSQVLFVAVAGYSVQHIGDSVSKILINSIGSVNIPRVVLYLVLFTLPYIASAAIFYFTMVRSSVLNENMQYTDLRVLVISLVNLSICLVLSVITDNIESTPANTIIGRVYAILGCCLCLGLQTGMFLMSKADRDKKTLQEMMLFEIDQHRLSKETIDFINIKCHDLKHQISKLNTQTGEQRSRQIRELSEAILIYDSIVKSGSDSLDIVLMEKKLLCEKYCIRFSYMTDGKWLSLMEDSDVYSLFGNMLDNAIESLCQEPDEEKRIMSLKVETHGQMLYIYMDNYYSTPVVMKEGQLQTTKSHEPGMHGFGVMSIQYIAKKYSGDALIHTEGDHFVIEIMIPLPDRMEQRAAALPVDAS